MSEDDALSIADYGVAIHGHLDGSGVATESLDSAGIWKSFFTQMEFVSEAGFTAVTMRQLCSQLPIVQLADSIRDSVVPDYVRPPSLYENSLHAFTPSEIRLYALANKRRWTESELTEVIELLRDPTFLRRDIGPDVQTRV